MSCPVCGHILVQTIFFFFKISSHVCIKYNVEYELKADTVRTTRPEKCDIFTQRYQSQPINKKFQKHC